ncbi:MAG: ABC transporter permease, partial [Terrimicrobiaceae bacterium]|nr:ABC transporter permease [Terrimicrobiaceae bacterium]
MREPDALAAGGPRLPAPPRPLEIAASLPLDLPALLRPPARGVLLKQIYFTGIGALPLLALAGFLGGWLLLHQLFQVMRGDLVFTIEVMRFLLVQEGSVFLVAMFVLARSGGAMASELAAMRLQGETAQLERWGVNLRAYLVAPRVWGAGLAVAGLVVCVQILVVLGGFAMMSLFANWDFQRALEVFA